MKNNLIRRRKFLGGAAAIAGLNLLSVNESAGANTDDIAADLPIYNVYNYDISGDGSTMNTEAFQNLIDLCSKNGGGTVFFPPGDFLTGTFELKNNVNIFLSPGTKIWGSQNKKDYKHDCLVYAADAKNISIKGFGTIHGNGKAFWEKRLHEDGDWKWAVKSWRPNRMFQFFRCENLRLHNFTIEQSPSWTIHPIDCHRVVINGIVIMNGLYEDDGPNTDGINPDGCTNVLISDCCLLCGDDCIVLKITEQSQTKVCRDIVVTNCVLQTSQTGLKIGTETHGTFKNITFSNCTVFDSGGGFALIMRDGGIIDGVVVNNISIHATTPKQMDGQGIYVWSHKRTEDTPWGMIRNVLISNMTIYAAGGIFISGAKEKHIEGLTLKNIRINISGGRFTTEHENPSDPFTVFGHFTAPYDIFCRYVDDLKLSNVQISWPESEDERFGSALRCWSVNDLEIDGFRGRQSLNSNAPAISFKNVNSAFVHNCNIPNNTDTVFDIDNDSRQITILGNDFGKARKLYVNSWNTTEIFESSNRLPNAKD